MSQSPPSPDERAETTRLLVACAWLVGFCVLFFSFTLPNNRPLSRVGFWGMVPFQLLDLVDPPVVEGTLPSGLGYLSQRVDLVGVALFLLLGCRAIGALLLRLQTFAFLEDRLEREAFAWAVGLSAWSLVVLDLGYIGLLSRWLFVALPVGAILADAVLWWRSRTPHGEPAAEGSPLPWLAAVLVTPFVVAIVLGAALPSTDFDAKAYHLLGPKEFYLRGHVGFLPYNVYTSFPFLTEMLTLSGMVVRGDWFRGALVGKLVLAAFGPLAALGVFVTARRWFGSAAGWVGVIVHLTTPWTFRISTIAYAEGGLSFFLLMATFATLLAVEALRTQCPALGPCLLAGLMAGSAMACKYPALITVVLPLGTALVAVAWFVRRSETSATDTTDGRRSPVWVGGAFVLGCAIAVGPWLLKNVIETGNPVYPLAYSVFGGRDLNPELAAKWTAGHSPDEHDVTRLPFWLVDVTLRNDWLSPLLYGLAPLAFLVLWNSNSTTDRRASVGWIVGGLWVYVACLFVVWWVFTHRIDRFWVPMLPVVAVLAGVGATRLEGRAWQAVVGATVALVTAFNLAFVTSGLSGNNTFLVDLDASRTAVARMTAPPVAAANDVLPEGARVLCVGEAQLFDATFDAAYNSVFDASLFVEWVAETDDRRAADEWVLKPTEEIRRTLEREGITHVLVSWADVRRYRRTYGFSTFVVPSRFKTLRERGLVGTPINAEGALPLSPEEAADVRTWAPSLLVRIDPQTGRPTDSDNGVPAFGPSWQIFPVE